MFLEQCCMRLINDFLIKSQDASDILARTLDGMEIFEVFFRYPEHKLLQ